MIQFYKIKRLFQISPLILANKISELPIKKIKNITLKKYLKHNNTFNNKEYHDLKLFEIFKLPNISYFENQTTIIENVVNQFIEHKFDLLGSGITHVAHNERYKGFNQSKYFQELNYTTKNEFIQRYINPQNRAISENIISLLPAQ